jgi:hypothetical protein
MDLGACRPVGTARQLGHRRLLQGTLALVAPCNSCNWQPGKCTDATCEAVVGLTFLTGIARPPRHRGALLHMAIPRCDSCPFSAIPRKALARLGRGLLVCPRCESVDAIPGNSRLPSPSSHGSAPSPLRLGGVLLTVFLSPAAIVALVGAPAIGIVLAIASISAYVSVGVNARLVVTAIASDHRDAIATLTPS